MIKIIGHTNGGYYSPEGNFIEMPTMEKTFKKYGLRALLFHLKCAFCCDWIEIEEDGKITWQ